MNAWADGLLRNSLQGGLAILFVFLFFRIFPRIPGSVQVWMWRVVALKLLVGMALPITVITQDWEPGLTIVPSRIPSVILLCTLLGVVLTVASLLQDGFAVRKINRGGAAVDMDISKRLLGRMGLKRLPIVLLRSDIDRPMLSGIWKPIVHLPSHLSEEAQEMVLAHEFAHIKRKDLAWEWLFVAVECLFFFHPLVWLMRREHRMSQEIACDALAMQTVRTSIGSYGRMLLGLAVADKRKELAFTANMAGTYAALHTRILRLHKGRTRIGAASIAALAAIGLTLLPTWRGAFRAKPFYQPSGTGASVASRTRLSSPPTIAEARTPKEGRP